MRSKEKFGLPWIVYYCNINENNIVFEICYLSSIKNSNIGNEATYSDISAILAPSYPLANTFSDKNKNAYNFIIEKEIVLDFDIKTTATIYDYNEENYWHRINYRFRYNDILVSVWNYDAESYDFINEEFLSYLSFAVDIS